MRPLLIVLFFSWSAAALAQFPAACSQGNPHFPGPATAIDAATGGCSLPGSAPTMTGDKLKAEENQNSAKNNFCAQGDPAVVTIKNMADLQAKVTAQKLVTPREPPLDRSGLVTLGEGNLVQFVGFVFEAKQEGAESVNCGDAVPDAPASHDIHIALLTSKRKTDPNNAAQKTQAELEECTSIVAEMIPHHRPLEWNPCNVNQVASQGLKVRVTGQQFFDASHVTCNNGKPVASQPNRVSLWEIHPIYSFEVCPSGTCANGGWQPLETFFAGKTTCK